MRRSVVLLAALALTSVGCVAFEKETMVFVFSKDSKEVRALFVYEGIRVNGERADDLKKAKEQIGRFVGEQEFCLGNNWPFHVDLADSKSDRAEEAALKARVRSQLVIRNGGFFLDKQGKLCGWQTITIKDRDKLLGDINFVIATKMAELAERERKHSDFDEATLNLIQKACKDKHTWARVEPGRISLTIPLSPATAAKLKSEVLGGREIKRLREALEKPLKPKADDADGENQLAKWWSSQRYDIEQLHRKMQFFLDAPLSIDQRVDRLTLALGLGSGEPIRLAVHDADVQPLSKADESLIEHARTLKVAFKKDASAEGLIADFIKKAGAEK